MKKVLEILLLCWAVVLLMGADTADARFRRLGGKIMCTCGDCTYMLLECNHVGCPNSTRMISELRALTGATTGEPVTTAVANLKVQDSDEAVLNWFRKSWGATAVIEPRTYGLELWAWLMPPLALALGLLLAIIVIRRWHRPRATDAASVQVDAHLEALRARARRETEI